MREGERKHVPTTVGGRERQEEQGGEDGREGNIGNCEENEEIVYIFRMLKKREIISGLM